MPYDDAQFITSKESARAEKTPLSKSRSQMIKPPTGMT
jgi:hypothetical protein